ncbi:NrfD/PsrC family molybdoenzyme membrane anchor subunit [Draconibacterium halophilum]|uniref:Polysulfide reductase NrfD n=1 Tax=Draconibacterium halophilum TaxID=2706887 RepID=A0A6C0RDD4_9BACT|nr:NrfD/PsrC family molybdoenzyme membrane anchor subunit [Draconibacterium halophilum]QIA07503.1 polysulfide reductase NrfD [Draconibacterium halophilum]
MTSPTFPLKKEKKPVWRFLVDELKPRGKWLTPFNIISIPVILVGLAIIVYRFINGIGAVSNVTQEIPWGLWKGFNVITGVAFAGGAYVLTFVVYVMRVQKFHSIVRVTVLNGFLAYVFYAGALVLDLGKPWNIFNPIIGNNFGANSVLFLVAWHFLLYIVAQLIEFSPAIAEWLGARRIHKILSGLTLGAVIFGITLSTLHQSGLGALFLMAKEKIHPLWYSEFIPLLFLVSSVFAGLSMVIFEGSISGRVFSDQITEKDKKNRREIVLSLSRICGFSMFIYLFLQVLVFVHGHRWAYLNSPMGYWFLLEMLGFVVLPMLFFIQSFRASSITWARVAAVITMVGIVLNRLNVSIVAFRWDSAAHYVPSWMEIVVSFTIIFIEIWIFRWIITRMPVLRESPSWAKSNHN